MIITSKDLIEIEKKVGYDCVAGVHGGYNQGDLVIRVYALHPVTQKRFTFDHCFTEKQIKFGSPILMLNAFTLEATCLFYEEFNKQTDLPQQGKGLLNRG